jgi:Cytochrome c554 and c-prime
MVSRSSIVWVVVALVLGCSSSPPDQQVMLTRQQLLDPAACQGCHPDQYSEWAGSMHAYSAKDPVFRAMNARGQRETDGGLGAFCVQCHAPMAVREGATTNGLNLDTVAQPLHGVTCFFCHSVTSVNGAHNNPLGLGTDDVLHGSFADPFTKDMPHKAAYSEFLDRDTARSAEMCGTCHDIHAPLGGDIERTFSEWQSSVFAQIRGATCSQCHMPQSTAPKPVANVPGAPLRRTHSHAFPAVDLAVTDFPDKENQRALVESFLGTTLQTAICVEPFAGGVKLGVLVDNVATGHFWPSGAAQDRRAWFEVVAYSGSDVVYQSGVVPEGANLLTDADPDIWLLRDCMFDETGSEVSMFWEAFDFESNTLPVKVTFDPMDPRYYQTHKIRYFPPSGAPIIAPAGQIDRITLQAHIQPVGRDILDELVHSGDLDPAIRDAMPTLPVGGMLEWTPATGTHTYVNRDTGGTVFCATNSNINVQADKFPAPVRTRCSP